MWSNKSGDAIELIVSGLVFILHGKSLKIQTLTSQKKSLKEQQREWR